MIRMLFGCQDPDLDPLVTGADPHPDPAPDSDPSIFKEK
jgi:hypothetical protein